MEGPKGQPSHRLELSLLHEDAGLIRSDLYSFSKEDGNPDSCAKVASFENTMQHKRGGSRCQLVTSALSHPSTRKMRKLRHGKGEGLGHNDPAP